jgi:predicted tellurium resistance membrane protein TerC
MSMDLAINLPSLVLCFADAAPAASPAGTKDLFTIANLIAVITLSAMEIVLGIDNVVFVAIIAGRAAADQRDKVRKIGLALGVLLRVILLFSIGWLASLTAPLFTIMERALPVKILSSLAAGFSSSSKVSKRFTTRLRGQRNTPPLPAPQSA